MGDVVERLDLIARKYGHADAPALPNINETAGDAIAAIEARDSRIAELIKVSSEFLEATEALCDWLNNHEIVADHAMAQPDDHDRLNAAMEAMQGVVRPTPPKGADQ